MEKSDQSNLNSKLHLIVLPTEKCNFRCVYCYEDFNVGTMKPEVEEGIKNLLQVRGPELSSLQIGWFGGEPLLGFHVIENIMTYVLESMPKSADLEVKSDITTNGFMLNRQIFDKLLRLKVNRFQISFDGDKEDHDKLRVQLKNKPTFDKIWSNIEYAHSTDQEFTVVVRLHLNSGNEESVRSFLDRYSQTIGNDQRFILFIRGLERLGGKNDANLPILEGGEKDKVYDRIRKHIDKLGLNHRLFAAKSGTENGLATCYASKLNSMVIRADGRIAKCTVALYDDINTIGRINRNGTIEIDNSKLRWWTRGLFSGDKVALFCPYLEKSFSTNKRLMSSSSPD